MDEGQARFADVLRTAAADLPLEDLADEVLRRLEPGGGTKDDIALLLVQVPSRPSASAAWLRLPLTQRAAGQARQFVAEILTRWQIPAELHDAAVLMTSELATNALLHGRVPVEVRVARAARRVVLEVSDGSSHGPQRRRAAEDEEGGRGLELVSACASRWGVRMTATGKTVWCELVLPG